MNRYALLAKRVAGGAMLFLLLAIPGFACASPGNSSYAGSETPEPFLTQSDSGAGGIAVQATWATASHFSKMPQIDLKRYPVDRFVLIHLVLDTHSVDLSQYDLSGLSTLEGRTSSATPAAVWIGSQESSHHREGVLALPGASNAEWQAREGIAKLVLSEIGGVPERVFVWEFPPGGASFN